MDTDKAGVTKPLTYAAVTPARDEEENLARLGKAMVNQTLTPVRWVIVENGSTDGTLDLARRLQAAHSFIRVIQTPPASAYERTSAYMRAFHAGVVALDDLGELVVKLDADVSVDPDYFEGLAAAFTEHPDLGITSGVMVEQRGDTWEEIPLLDDHCMGPTRAYRRTCLEAVLPLEDGYNYASVDETRAHLAGFTTRTLRHLRFRHHRPEGSGEGSGWKNWRNQGLASHHMHYRPSYVLARFGFRIGSEPRALALLTGYAEGFVRRAPRYDDARVVHALRERQRLRRLPAALRARHQHVAGGHAR
jgi:poly-beta-1,6-N-acetyl-D-glucosamine synthase